jgi:hypothetical protein
MHVVRQGAFAQQIASDALDRCTREVGERIVRVGDQAPLCRLLPVFRARCLGTV